MVTALTPSSALTKRRGPTVGDPTVTRSLHTVGVVTPQAVLLEFPAAGVASRVLAKMLDFVIQIVIVFALALGSIPLQGSGALGAIVITVGLFLVVFAYPALSEAFWNGQTIGKRVLGIRVITLQGGPARFRHSSIRALISVPEFFMPPGGLTALISALLTRRTQRVGDLAAGTVVIRDHSERTQPIFFAPARGAEAFSTTLDASLLSAQQYGLIRDFLVRAPSLTPAARYQLATDLAQRTERVLGFAPPPGIHPESVLVSAAFAYQRRYAS